MPKDTYTRYKLVLLGSCNTGKTCLTIRYVNKQFSNLFQSTIGCSFMAKVIEKDNVKYGLDIWDTAGQERYRSLLPMYYRNADVVIICFDLTENLTTSFADINYWIKELRRYDDNISRIVLLVGTKCDMVDESTINNITKTMNNKYNEIELITTSSKEDIRVNELFDKCLDITIKNNNASELENVYKQANPAILELTEKPAESGWFSSFNIAYCSIL